ncbi:MAG TPA: hypothetical protein ENI86_10475, partial [Acidimicrobiales bacterium]|nr:hypothetical protein [Acidimicrobiales bacterium]
MRSVRGKAVLIPVMAVLLASVAFAVPSVNPSAAAAEAAPAGWAWNFQPAGSPTPEGFTPDSGAPYNPTTGYGWTALDA